jgi:hypothetical protein
MLDRFRRRWRLVYLQRGLLLTLGVLTGAVGLAVAADRLLRLAPTLRAVAMAAIAVLFVACLGKWVLWPALKRISDRDAAVRLGRRFPKMEEDLVSAVELSGDRRQQEGISRALVISVLGRIAGRAVAAVNPRSAVPVRPLLVAAAAFAVVGAAFMAGYLARPEAVRNALIRIFQPTRAVPFFSYTALIVRPGDQVIRVGDTAEVTVALSGRVPGAALLDARNGSGALKVTLPCEAGQASWRSEPLFEDLRYRVLAGDAVSDWYRVRVLPPPSLRSKSAVLHEPDYAGGSRRVVESIQGPLEIIAGTAVVLRGEPMVRGEGPQFRCTGEMATGDTRLPLKSDSSGLLVSPSLLPKASATYAISLKDGFGLASRSPDSIFVKVSPDDVPKVNITEPARDLMLLPGERVAVAAEAQDEFGLRSLILCTRLVKDAAAGAAEAAPGPATAAPVAEALSDAARWERKTIKDGGVKVRQLGAKADLGLDAMALAPGDVVEYRAEASDYASDAPLRRGTSRIFRVTVISEAQHRERVMERLRELQMELLRRASEQKAEAARVGSLAAAKTPLAESARSAQDRETALARGTESLARKFEALIPEMARNPSTPTSALAEVEHVGRAIASVAGGPMASAAKSLGQAADAPPDRQAPPLQKAQKSENDAAERLENLARAAERLQRNALLDALAAQAERLAARQRELKAETVQLAPKTVAMDPKDMKPEFKGALERLAAAQQSLKTGTDALASDIQRAAASLAFSMPADAAAARDAAEKLEADKVADKMTDLEREDRRNVLFAPLPKHDEIVASLTDVAKTLRRSDESMPMAAMAKEIEEFIRRQKELNAEIEATMNKIEKAPSPAAEASKQSGLARDVTEQAGALRWLAQEIEGFESAAAGRLTGAAGEMREGSSDLYATKVPDGLEHGRKALALLEESLERFGGESGQMAGAAQARGMFRALLLLVEILSGQKRLNRDTVEADEIRAREGDVFNRRVAGLSEKQSGLRVKARRLEEMLAQYEGAAAMVAKAGGKMDASRLALAEGDTGNETRVVQRQAVALLEQLIRDHQGRMGGMGLAGMRMMALADLLAQMGMSPGGFAGGTNAPILPANVDRTDDERWRRVGSRFEGNLSEGAEETYPVQFRGLLNAYFERLRKEPMR